VLAGHITTAGKTPDTEILPPAGLTLSDDPNAKLAQATISGNDNTGQLGLSIGDSSGPGDLIRVKLQKPFEKAPQVFLSPTNTATAQMKYYVTSSTDGFKVVATEPLQPGTNLQFFYWVVQ
jgi:hypothetical protein